MTSPAGPQFDTVTIDCPEPAALGGFYGALLDWPVTRSVSAHGDP